MRRYDALTLVVTLVATTAIGISVVGTGLDGAGGDAYRATGSSSDRTGSVSNWDEPIRPITEPVGLDPALVALGRRLFHDTRFSTDGATSCASCHDVTAGGSVEEPLPRGTHGRYATRNAPTVFNAALNVRQHWDGKFASLEEQIDGPIGSASELGLGWDGVLAVVRGDSEYRDAFATVNGRREPTRDDVRTAIATYERALVTPGARFDAYLKGDSSALDASEKSGYELFKRSGCSTCHQGVNVGGNMFQRLGRVSEYQDAGSGDGAVDLGRFLVTGSDRDRHAFKVPTLRNVTLTAPYFHDGSVATLEDAVQRMARHQLGVEFTAEQVALLVRFLGTLEARPVAER